MLKNFRQASLSEVRRTVEHYLPQPLILKKIPKENVINSNKPVVHLVRSSAFQTLQNVSPTVQKITNNSQSVTVNSNNAINQQTPSVRVLQKRVDNNTASAVQQLSTTQHYIVNPKDVTLPSSCWFWQEGSLLDHELICSKFKWLDENKFEYTKTVIINGDSRTLRFFVRGQQVFYSKLKYQFSMENELIDCLQFYDKIPECVGYSDQESLKISASSNVQVKSSGCETRSENCLLLGTTNSNSCRNCMKKDTRLKKNEKPSNGSKKTCNIPSPCRASSEPPVTHVNLDDNVQEPEILNFRLDHNYGVMTSPTTLDNRPMKISMISQWKNQLDGLSIKLLGNRSENEENDKNDLELAKRFLKNETARKRKLQKKLNQELKMVKE